MDNKIQYVLFDVVGTILNKPSFYTTLFDILKENGYGGNISELKIKHKIASEIIHFPDRTHKEFYHGFNENLLFSLGMIPTEKILEEIFARCSYLPWEKFSDTDSLFNINLPMGILSNFNSTLKEKLDGFFGPVFKDIFVSEELGISKPSIGFYQKAVERIGVLPENILYIGDSLKLDIRPALSVGMKPLLIDRDGFFPHSEYAISDLGQVLNYI